MRKQIIDAVKSETKKYLCITKTNLKKFKAEHK